LPGKGIFSIYISGKSVFLICQDGIYETDGSLNNPAKIVNTGITAGTVEAMTDSYDKLWFVIRESMLIYYNPVSGENRIFNIPTGKALPQIKISDGRELGVFVLSTTGELCWIDRNDAAMRILNNLPELKKDGQVNTFMNFIIDKDNILWLTSITRGITRVSFPKKQFNLIQLSAGTGSNDNSVKTLFRTKNGDIWAATRKAEVYQMDRTGKVKRVFSASQHFDFGTVYHIMEDRSGNLWFSSKGRGLVKAIPDPASASGFRFERFEYNPANPSSLSGNEVYYTYQDSKGRIWVALFGGGLNLIDEKGGKTGFFNKFNSFSNYPKYGLYMEIRSITEDSNGRIWVGASDGLMSFRNDFKNPEEIDFEIYRNDQVRSNVSDNDIYVLFRDSENQIWISIFGGGLNKLESYNEKLKRPEFKTYSLIQGLNSDVILSVVEDDAGYLWLATENSIVRFDKKKESFRNFDRYDGFIDVKMEEESAVLCPDGKVWFGSRMGILSFNPGEIETYNCDYHTIIVSFLVSNRELRSLTEDPEQKINIAYAEKVKLKYNQNNIVIEFAALNYYNLNRVSYKYMLEGYEDEWHYNGRNRIASYPNLPPGRYKFIVQTTDEANADLKSEKVLYIRVLPPWWRSWWAYMIYAVLLLMAVYAAIKLVLFTIKMRNDVYIEQKVSDMKLRFFTNISHELRTPLTLIMGPVHELKEKQQLSDKGKQYVSIIENSANQMLNLVNQILDFRKLQHGKMVLHVAHLELNKMITEVKNEFELLAEEKEISYSCQLSEDDVLLWGDKERLEIVIRNLISNAFKFTEKGGSIYVSSGLTVNHQKCFIRVEDTGIGIPQNKLTEIFERFTQGENSKNPYYQGTGIGLHLSKEIVSLHQGTIGVERKQDKGSVFTVELLLGKNHFNPEEVNFYMSDESEDIPTEIMISEQDVAVVDGEEDLIDNQTHLPVILVVEDNRDLCNLLKMQLEDKYKVLLAYNGREGLKKILHHHPDLVVTDIMMPEMSGIEMLQEIRKDIRISHIPVVILTAKQNEEAKIQAISMGANAYITKPFNKEYLIARIEQLLNDRKMFRERIWNQETTQEVSEEETYENYLVKKDLQLLERIHQVIGENISNPDYNIDAIAGSLGFSRSAFFKKLKSLTGLAPVDLIKEIRLTKSLELLKNTDMTISEIAFDVGFRDSGYYGKCFRKKYNQTPTEFISAHRNEVR
jgi:signal transduction histidine kinase/DNA-binding response OmpR family regulator/streptogramin lyase